MMSINRGRLGAIYGPIAMELTPERVAAYAVVVGGNGAVAHPAFGILPVWPGLRMLADESLGLDVGRLVHGEQRMTLHRPLRSGDALESLGTLTSIEERGANEVLVLSFATRDADGHVVVEQDVVVVSRGTASGNAAPAGAVSDSRPAHATEEASAPPAAERGVALDHDVTVRYAQASGDDNRIHLDDAFACENGLPGVIVQGMCLLAISVSAVVDELADGHLARVRGLRARPLRPGEIYRTQVWPVPEGARFVGLASDGAPALRDGGVELGAGAGA